MVVVEAAAVSRASATRCAPSPRVVAPLFSLTPAAAEIAWETARASVSGVGFRRKRKAINSSVTRTRMPGVRADGESELVQARTVPGVVAEKSRAAMMLGAREGEAKHADQVYRDIGIPIFDLNAGRSQLHDIIQRGRGK